MAGVLQNGGAPLTMGLEVDDEGYRDYSVEYLVKAAKLDGPHAVFMTPGLPVTGSFWVVGSDLDTWVHCTRYRSIRIHDSRPEASEGPVGYRFWRAGFKFSNRPQKNCSDDDIEDPLLMPQKVGGTFLRYTKEATHDRYGYQLTNSSHEQMRGPQVEFDENKRTVKVEQNVAILDLAQLDLAVNRVNSATMWGLSPRCVKLSTISWDEKWYGTCNKYFVRQFEFDVNADTFDRTLPDEGTRVLRGHWDERSTLTTTGSLITTNPTWGTWVLDDIAGATPDNTNPTHFIRYKDWNGENTRVMLDGAGQPCLRMVRVGTGTGVTGSPGDPGYRIVEKYEEYDHMLLGVPALLGP